MAKTVLVIDGGGRGSALVDKYAQSAKVGKVLAVPGNDLMKFNPKKPLETFPELKTTSEDEILKICRDFKVDLVDVAQDNAIEAGVSDLLRENGFKVTGPSRAAGQIEWDKSWARQFLKKTRALQPEYHAFDSFNEGIGFIKSQPEKSWFIKASGLAEGKGALPAKNNSEAIEKIKELEKFGESGKNFLIEEWLIGEEFSAFTISDGKSYQYIGAAQDHKRVFEGDKGENTGGMGCSTPPLVLTENILNQVYEIMGDTLYFLADMGRPYQGVLYLGGMIVDGQVYVIEFNARWGDPEAQVIVPGIKNDFFDLSMAVAEKKLDELNIETDGIARVVVAGCSKGYPADYSSVKGKQIFGLDQVINEGEVKVFGAGVKVENGKFLANGGRLFYLVGEGKDIKEARDKAYNAMKKISIEGDNLHFRTDIGYRDVERLKTGTD